MLFFVFCLTFLVEVIIKLRGKFLKTTDREKVHKRKRSGQERRKLTRGRWLVPCHPPSWGLQRKQVSIPLLLVAPVFPFMCFHFLVGKVLKFFFGLKRNAHNHLPFSLCWCTWHYKCIISVTIQHDDVKLKEFLRSWRPGCLTVPQVTTRALKTSGEIELQAFSERAGGGKRSI